VQAYVDCKWRIAAGATGEVGVFIDFMQLHLEHGFLQNMVSVIVAHDPDSTDQLKQTYFDFVSEKGDKHDVNFVGGVWHQLMTCHHEFFSSACAIHIWTDGGPHHFHVSTNLWIFSQLQCHFPQYKFTYHFHIANHSHSICNTSASHSKRRIITIHHNKQRPMEDAHDIVSALNTLNHHIALIAARIPGDRMATDTLKGIKSLNAWQWDPPSTLRAWSSSLALLNSPPTKIFDVTAHIIEAMPPLFQYT
jgi:hypothetical protein